MDIAPRSYRLSAAQERLWFLEQLQPGTALYNLPYALRCKGTLDVEVLHSALDELVHRHASLRTRFVAVDGVGRQVVDPLGRMAFAVVDLSAERSRFNELLNVEAIRPFDISAAPPVRATLFRLDVFEHVLLLSIHHIITDGRSLSVLMRELNVLYSAFRHKKSSPLEPIALQYVDYAAQQHEPQQRAVLDQLEYWRSRRAGAPAALDLPCDHTRPAVQSFRGGRHVFDVPAAMLTSLRALSKRNGVTLFTILMTAFQVLLSRWSGQEDITVGFPVSGRRPETDALVGFFINTLVLRTEFHDDPSFAELVQRVREQLLEAYRNQDVPFEKVVQAIQPTRDMSRHPIFQAAINYSPVDYSPFYTEELSITAERVPTHTVKFDLELFIEKFDDALRCRFDFASDLFEASTVQRLAGHWLVLLAAAVEQPEIPVSQLPMLTERERHQLLVEWNDTSRDYHER